MRKKFLAILLAILFISSSFIYAEGPKNEDLKPLYDKEENIELLNIEKEWQFEDKWYVNAPNGTATKTFSTDSNDKYLNCYFNNNSNVRVTVTLYKKSGWFGSYQEVNSMNVAAGSQDFFTINNPDSDVKYKIEVSNRTGDKILGVLRVRSYSTNEY